MISCHASPVALLGSNHISAKVNAAPHSQGFTVGNRYSSILPEEEGQGLEKGLEVVVMIDCAVLNQLDVSKHLRKQESRWFSSNQNIHGQSLPGYSAIQKGPHRFPSKFEHMTVFTVENRAIENSLYLTLFSSFTSSKLMRRHHDAVTGSVILHYK